MGLGVFKFSDDYSVFDWGQMPDQIPGKGAALCLIGAYFFEEAERQGLYNHFAGIESKHSDIFGCLKDATSSSDRMGVSLVNVLRPRYVDDKYDYSAYAKKPGNILLPLEVIYRNSLPEGSSVFKRLKSGQLKPEDLGLDHSPVPGEKLEKPFYDYSTKLEPTDRYLKIKKGEPKRIAGLSDDEFGEVEAVLGRVNDMITAKAEPLGLSNEDGKIELALTPEREVMLVDVFGTLDESRYGHIKTGLPLSKEVLRELYKKTDWYQEVESAKKSGLPNWKEQCSQPSPLDNEIVLIVSDMYQSAANAITGRNFFEVPRLDEVMGSYKDWLNEKKLSL
jgi:phosphoribosylaminoimidazole-succinocarboxamide synthase